MPLDYPPNIRFEKIVNFVVLKRLYYKSCNGARDTNSSSDSTCQEPPTIHHTLAPHAQQTRSYAREKELPKECWTCERTAMITAKWLFGSWTQPVVGRRGVSIRPCRCPP
ncbi:hypothetical protein QQF64_001517 [Cirrhinus molitorella]|uniref:Uncharacterized protein n=1 Tax=Cirrhinus molitorella TaxID=172907 RepID=A0ABR3P0K6_9TELE